MVFISVASFERFFREAADLDVDKTDLKRFQAFVRERIADLLTIAQAGATVDDRGWAAHPPFGPEVGPRGTVQLS